MTEPEIAYRFTPPFEGAFIKHVPQRDLTQQEVDALDPVQRNDALTPHPLYGTPCYTPVEKPGKPDKKGGDA